jgi:hypothetical protein
MNHTAAPVDDAPDEVGADGDTLRVRLSDNGELWAVEHRDVPEPGQMYHGDDRDTQIGAAHEQPKEPELRRNGRQYLGPDYPGALLTNICAA